MALGQFSSTEAGIVPSSGGGTTKYLRADGTFATVTSTAPDIALSLVAPSIDETITAGYSAYISGTYEIASSFMLDILTDSVFEIG